MTSIEPDNIQGEMESGEEVFAVCHILFHLSWSMTPLYASKALFAIKVSGEPTEPQRLTGHELS